MKVLALAGVLLFVPAAARAAISISLAELNNGQLRLEGNGAVPNASISVNGTAQGTADANGAFKIQIQPFSSPSCQVTVSDGSSSAMATLAGCTPSAPGKPTFFVRTTVGLVGSPLQFQAQGSNPTGNSLAFVFAWGDGTILRDPATGFYAVDPVTRTVSGFPVTHAWISAGTFTVTITAVDPSGASTVSDPILVTISAPAAQNDCGTGGDAGDTVATATLITLPVNCSGVLDPAKLDFVDVYKFNVTQPFRLLTVTISPASGFRLGIGEINLIDPTGTPRGAAIGGFFPPTTGDLSFLSLCGAPNIHCANPSAPAQSFGFGYTLDMTGEWKLMLGGDFTVGGTYTMSIHTGGGGDDCVQGRAPTLTVPPPVDAPNQALGLRLLDVTETNCTGSLPFPDLDFHDLYVFPVVLGEQVVVSVASTDGLPPCSGAIGGAIQGPFGKAGGGSFGCTGDLLFRPVASGNAGITLTPTWSATTDLRNYRLRVATSAHHNGDCFTGADAGNASATATPMPISACIGDISATDLEDWYSFGASVGQQIGVLSFPSGGFFDAAANFVSQPVLPVELYGPDGLRRGTTSALADQSGSWRVRVASSLPGLPQYAGSYGIQVIRTAPFASLTVNPGTVGGGTSAQGTINLGTTTTDPVFFYSIDAVPNNIALIPQSLGSLTIPPGSSSATFPINTSPVTASTSVTISASTTDFAGNIVTKTAILTVVPPPAPPVAGDTVTITRAEYVVSKQQLRVDATSISTTATLTISVTASGQVIGTLANNGAGGFSGQLNWPVNPQNITAKSSAGGSATASVTAN